LHEAQNRIGQRRAQRRRVTAQERREIGVDRGGLGARQQPGFVRDLVRGGDVVEADLARERGERALHLGERRRVDQRDRHRPVSLFARARERAPRLVGVERLDDRSIRPHARVHLEHGARQRRRLADRELEQLGPLLRADREQIAEARIGDEQRRDAASLEQRVRGHRGAELDAHARRRCIRRARARVREDLRDQPRGRVVGGQHLGDVQRAVGRDADPIRERPAAVDPERPVHPISARLRLAARGGPLARNARAHRRPRSTRRRIRCNASRCA
jgi:hypothetical protein